MAEKKKAMKKVTKTASGKKEAAATQAAPAYLGEKMKSQESQTLKKGPGRPKKNKKKAKPGKSSTPKVTSEISKTTKKESEVPVSKKNNAVSKDDYYAQVRELAYFKYVERGYQNGCHESDWLEAEIEIKKRNKRAI